MQAKLIVMLTHNDVTVANAQEVFESCKDLPVEYWGFKNVGLDDASMKSLITSMKHANKKTFIEVVTYTEESCLSAAHLAVELGCDYFTGSLFFPAVWEYLKNKPIRYFPFIGKVGGSPVTLHGTMAEIVAEARSLEAMGVPGIDIVAYRYKDGDPEELAVQVVRAVQSQVIMAGSIASHERIRIVNAINPFAFTMGSALFDQLFVPGKSFRENLQAVISFMETI